MALRDIMSEEVHIMQMIFTLFGVTNTAKQDTVSGQEDLPSIAYFMS